MKGLPARGWWICAGEVVRQGGHGQSAEDGERARYHEGGRVVARDIFEEPFRGKGRKNIHIKTQSLR